MQDWIVSDYFSVRYRDEEPDPPYTDQVDKLFDAKTRSAGDFALSAADTKALPALRAGLRMADPQKRWRAFEYVCKHPRLDMVDDVAGFQVRWGSTWISGCGTPGDPLVNFAKILPEAERLAFYERILAAMPCDNRTALSICADVSGGKSDAQLALALTICERLYALGDREFSRLNCAAWLYSHVVPESRRNLKLAIERARETIKVKPDYWDAWHTLAVNLLESGQPEEALKAAEKAVALKPKPEYVETLEAIRQKLGASTPKK